MTEQQILINLTFDFWSFCTICFTRRLFGQVPNLRAFTDSGGQGQEALAQKERKNPRDTHRGVRIRMRAGDGILWRSETLHLSHQG